jgi:hypothetical protein
MAYEVRTGTIGAVMTLLKVSGTCVAVTSQRSPQAMPEMGLLPSPSLKTLLWSPSMPLRTTDRDAERIGRADEPTARTM